MNEDTHPSLSPGTKTKVDEARSEGKSERIEARASKYSLYSMLPPLPPPRPMTACWVKFPASTKLRGAEPSGSEE